MPEIIIKPERGRDCYVIWSTIVESVTAMGDRAQTQEYLQSRPSRVQWDDPVHGPEARIRRADETGTSDMSVSEGSWNDEWLMAEQARLPRELLLAYAEACCADDMDSARAMTIPFDNDGD